MEVLEGKKKKEDRQVRLEWKQEADKKYLEFIYLGNSIL